MTPPKPIDRDYALSQIPWLINGTLDAEEAEAIEAFIATCETCQAELAEQQRLAAVVKDASPPIPDANAALDAIAHRLTPQRAEPRGLAWMKDMIDRLLSPSGAMMGGVLAATALLVVVGASLFEPRFDTLTSPAAATDGVEIRLRHQPGIPSAEIKDMLSTLGAQTVEGPSEGGVIRGVFDKDLADDIAETLRSDPRIIFVAKD